MKPASKTNFGPESGKIQINYHNGTSAVTGYIVKQLGSKKYRVTTNGTDTFDVELAQTTAEATTLTAGKATIVLTPHGGGTKYVSFMQGYKAFCTDGTEHAWMRVATTATGQGKVDTIS